MNSEEARIRPARSPRNGPRKRLPGDRQAPTEQNAPTEKNAPTVGELGPPSNPAPRDAVQRTRERVERALRRGADGPGTAVPGPTRPEPEESPGAPPLLRSAAAPLAAEAIRERVERRLTVAPAASPEPEPATSVPRSSDPTEAPPAAAAAPADPEPAADAHEADEVQPERTRVAPLAAPETPDRRRRSRLAGMFATCLFIGRLPLAPGTWGTLAGLAAYYACRDLAVPVEGGLLALAICIGIWASGRYAADRRRKDPQEVVVDEFCGMWLALVGTQASPAAAISAFVLFRVLDIAKPPPIRQAERLPGGLGIMADDLLAAVGVRIALIVGYGADAFL